MAKQIGNTVNASVPAEPSQAEPGVPVGTEAPATVDKKRTFNRRVLEQLATKLRGTFDRYSSDRALVEERWIKNLRQIMAIYDPDVESQIPKGRSRAYPPLTRTKCLSLLARLMNLMFPGNEDNWTLDATPSPSLSPEAVAQAVSDLMAERQAEGEQVELTQELVNEAVRALARSGAKELTKLVKDQLAELGDDQMMDWIALNRGVAHSGIQYGIGVLEGPYVHEVEVSGWVLEAEGGFKPVQRTIYKPHFEVTSVWDFYPDMTARKARGEGYFIRKVLGPHAFRKLGDREDFIGPMVKEVVKELPRGNYQPRNFENDLRTMGAASNTDRTSIERGREKYEVIVWKGPVSANTLAEAGADVPDKMKGDMVQAEIWMVDKYVIKADISPWERMGVKMRQIHVFGFDEDDTSPIPRGLPQVMRHSALATAAATRMALDNASVVCGPNLEVNTALMRTDQDLSAVEAYKIWYRDDTDMTAQFPAVREIKIDSHLAELQSLIQLFSRMSDDETFVGPATGGDMQNMPSEPMRTAAGASMLRGEAALPFKDIVRNFDGFTQSVIQSIVEFNKKFNPDLVPDGDYSVIARGATSLIAKEVRGAQIDALSATLTEEERDHVDERMLVEAKFASRDLEGMLVSEDVAKRRQAARTEAVARQQALQEQATQANTRKVLSDAFKNITQGQKNSANADATGVEAATKMIEMGEAPNGQAENTEGAGD